MKAFKPSRPAAGVRKADAANAALNATAPIAIVGIGTSPNAVATSRAFLEALPPDTGLAFVFVQRPEAAGSNHFGEALEQVTSMPVTTIERSTLVQANSVYVSPPNSGLFMQDGAVHLHPYVPPGDYYIDQFLTSLAKDQRQRAIGVVMTDMANDGAVGLSAISSEGGLTCVHVDVATRVGISHTAEGSNGVDMIRSTTGLAEDLMRIARRRRNRPEAKPPARTQLEPILALLRGTAGIDFQHYQTALLWRCIQRRMLIAYADSLPAYTARLREEVRERQLLAQSVLSGYTCFFRDPEAFERLRLRVLPELFAKCARYDSLRIWAPGCSTGEEVYALAIVCAEVAQQIGSTVPFVIFGSDINALALETARNGLYPKSITRQVSGQRLQRYFVAEKHGYRVTQAIRDRCMFTHANVATDPPFLNVELISCRNVLGTMAPNLQQRVLPLFYLALKTHGVLFVGRKEDIDSERRWFEPFDIEHRFYGTVPGVPLAEPSFMLSLPVPGLPPEQQMLAELTAAPERRRLQGLKETERLLFEHFTPPGVRVDAQGKIQQTSGDITPYLNTVSGKGRHDVVSAALPGLQQPLRLLLQRARRQRRAIFRQRVSLRDDDASREVLLSAMPVSDDRGGVPQCWVLFENGSELAARKPAAQRAGAAQDLNNQVVQLREELTAAREGLETMNAQLWLSYQNLQTLREQHQLNSSDQQRTAERLKTSQRLLAEAQDEVATMGNELSTRLRELQAFDADWLNLLAGVPVAAVMLSRELQVRRFTPLAGEVLGLTLENIEQPLPETALDLRSVPLAPVLQEVIERGVERELEVSDRQGGARRLRVRALHAPKGAIDGVMLLLTEVDDG